jgi:hypothetical protein
MSFIEGTLATKYGAIQFACTDRGHVSITSGPLNVSPVFAVRGVSYHAHIHLFSFPGRWDVRDWRDLYTSRENQKQVSDAARKSIKEELVAVWTKHVEANPDILRQAHVNALASKHHSLNEEIVEAEGKLNDLKLKRDEILRELQAA